MKIYKDIEQGSEEWLNLRLGKISCSNLGKLFTGGKGLTRKSYIRELAYERRTGERVPKKFKSEAMQYGNDTESEARLDYMLKFNQKVEQIAFCEYNDHFGGSPDGLIDSDGVLEIKCLDYETMFDIFENPCLYKIDKNYIYQVQGLMLILERDYTDFYIYHPKLGSHLFKIKKDIELQKNILIEVKKANEEINILVELIKNRGKK
jgi:hypothetical protein